ncbi:hypothetical protein PC129_g15570 [Phytophthora cactorum]|uniref:DDE-1 domain-containing protein n=2 Tax=Phytophthora cactorum TaxID=29920 RepID=A0A8T1HL90_9STRA|nr:hypothetical protein PC111_g10383 [Phytophthora cactorum]KAG2901859.1 hypothetical protein PC114_g12993 [Phytophthora cactorum]KAG3031893.1 hypothetical protein PC119_g5848 [Phytophthora cactorum]KAG3213485.1 hypothetical protein PC129_g15570 [Phytophthora cactorum]KAG4038456.1 hypothetical protein PC123_g25978 [Phytophthora cactorum]
MERERVLLAGISLHQSSKALYTAGLRGGASTQSNTVALDSSQKTGDIICTNVRVEFLPPNTTAFLQPMDADIIASFKVAYRRKQLRWVYDKIKNGDSIGKKVYAVDQLQAMQWSKDIWRELQGKRTIESCCRHTGIVFNVVDERSKDAEFSSYGVDVEVEDIIVCAGQLSL